MAVPGVFTYNPDYHPARFIELSKLGWTKARIQADFDISRQCHHNWVRDYPDYAHAVEMGVVKAQAYQEVILERLSTGELEGNVTAQIFKMKSQFHDDYAERRYVHNDNKFTFNLLPDDQLNKQICAKLKMLSPQERLELLPQLENVLEGELVEEDANVGTE